MSTQKAQTTGPKVTISAPQCRAARALLGWSQDDLAAAANVHKRTIMDFETGKRTPHHGTLGLLVNAFAAAGVVFIHPDPTTGEGVRFRNPPDAGSDG